MLEGTKEERWIRETVHFLRYYPYVENFKTTVQRLRRSAISFAEWLQQSGKDLIQLVISVSELTLKTGIAIVKRVKLESKRGAAFMVRRAVDTMDLAVYAGKKSVAAAVAAKQFEAANREQLKSYYLKTLGLVFSVWIVAPYIPAKLDFWGWWHSWSKFTESHHVESAAAGLVLAGGIVGCCTLGNHYLKPVLKARRCLSRKEDGSAFDDGRIGYDVMSSDTRWSSPLAAFYFPFRIILLRSTSPATICRPCVRKYLTRPTSPKLGPR